MALIKCTECGKEISDKAVCCINCGCPVSEMKAQPAKTAAPAKQDKPADFNVLFGELFNGKPSQKAEPVKTVPTDRPEMRMFPGIIVSILDKFCGICGLAGFLAVGGLMVSLLSGEYINADFMEISFLGIPAALVCSWLKIFIEFSQVKKFLKKNGYEHSIRNDTPQWTNAINAYKLYPSMLMANYLKKLNPTIGNALVDAVKKNTAKKRAKRLRYVPYLLILAAVYYLLPRFEAVLMLPYESSLIICHLVTVVVMALFGCKKEFVLGLVVVVAVIFAPTIFAYFYSDMWYHILICAAAAFIGMLLGVRFLKKK